MPRFVLAWLILAAAGPALLRGDAGAPAGTGRDVADLSLEDLMQIEITSVSKKEQKLSQAPAAVFVITQEDIRRSTATSIPELLRIVPGLHVARIDSHTWAISARGFNGRFANKMLVLVDGRSVYTPLFSGVYWDSVDLMLEDIERIEVIRGPGAVMWGANAVNGVINVITKHTRNTRGTLLTSGAGTLDQGWGGVRQGGGLGRDGSYRVYTKYRALASNGRIGGGSAIDGWDDLRGGFRTDWATKGGDSFTVEGDTFRSNAGRLVGETPAFDAVRSSGGNVLGRWTRNTEHGSSALQVYYDRWDGLEVGVNDFRNTLDFDFQHQFAPWGRHTLMFGAGYRFIDDDVHSHSMVRLEPARERTSLYSGFVQDEIALWGDRVSLALGTKLEHNAYTGMEIEPGVRLGWNISPHQSVWAAVSRAVRTPSRRDRDLLGLNVGVLPSESLPMPVPFPVQLVVNGNKDHQDEVLLAHEIGYRVQPSRTVSLDFAGFFNRYHNVQGEFIETPILRMAPQPYFLLPAYFAAALKMHSFGAELAASWDVLPAWKLSAGYSWLNMSWGKDREDCWPMEARGADPHHQFNVRSYLDLPQRFSLDATASFSGRVAPYSGPAEAPVPAYLRTGLQVTRRFANGFEVSFAADDLTNGRHLEYQPETFGQGSLIGRSAYVRVAWRSLQ